MNSKKRNIIHIVLSVVLIALDQVTKAWARSYLRDDLQLDGTQGEYLEVVGQWARLTYIENKGAFLGLGDDWSNGLHLVVFSLLPLAFLAVFYFMVLWKNFKYTPLQLFAFTLFFSGGIGNIIDRIFRERHVTDFAIVGIPDSWHTGIFNVADMYVTAAAFILIGMALMPKKKVAAVEDKGKTEHSDTQ